MRKTVIASALIAASVLPALAHAAPMCPPSVQLQGEGELRFKLSLDAMRYQAERMAHLEALAELRRQP